MFTVADILTGTGGAPNPDYPGAANLVLRDVVVDSRQATPGSLFVALPGEVRDGHEFIADAVGRGAQGVLARTGWQPPAPLGAGVAVIWVEDTLRALQAWATWWRGRFPALNVIGIT